MHQISKFFSSAVVFLIFFFKNLQFGYNFSVVRESLGPSRYYYFPLIDCQTLGSKSPANHDAASTSHTIN